LVVAGIDGIYREVIDDKAACIPSRVLMAILPWGCVGFWVGFDKLPGCLDKGIRAEAINVDAIFGLDAHQASREACHV
jgi:hypothetical protein